MRSAALLILAATLAGCACQPKPAKESATVPATQPLARTIVYPDQYLYDPAIAHTLAFDPPLGRGANTLDLGREDRAMSAFVGYDEGVASYFYIRVDDQQYYNNNNLFGNGSSGSINNLDNSTYQRRTVSETVGVRYR